MYDYFVEKNNKFTLDVVGGDDCYLPYEYIETELWVDDNIIGGFANECFEFLYSEGYIEDTVDDVNLMKCMNDLENIQRMIDAI